MKNKKLYLIIFIVFLAAIGFGFYRYLNSDQSSSLNKNSRPESQNDTGLSAEGSPPAKPSPSGN